MSESENTEVWDNTGGESPDEKPKSWSNAKTPWPTGPFNGVNNIFPKDDPRSAVLKRTEQRMDLGDKGRWVLVEEDEINAILHLRICRSSHTFTPKELDLTHDFTAYCILQAGHVGSHTNGAIHWKPELIVAT